jgi:NADH-quinone oxidoreductase subunit C
MTAEDFQFLINEELDEFPVLSTLSDTMPAGFIVKPDQIVPVAHFLKHAEKCLFDLLECITGVHNPDKGAFEVIYNLYSIPLEHKVMVKVILSYNKEQEPSPEVDSLTSVWKSADWHERETFDLLGIKFKNHPDLRRILLPADWDGSPLRKNYKHQEYYRGIKVEY